MTAGWSGILKLDVAPRGFPNNGIWGWNFEDTFDEVDDSV
jgi:hypothetical protein